MNPDPFFHMQVRVCADQQQQCLSMTQLIVLVIHNHTGGPNAR